MEMLNWKLGLGFVIKKEIHFFYFSKCVFNPKTLCTHNYHDPRSSRLYIDNNWEQEESNEHKKIIYSNKECKTY